MKTLLALSFLLILTLSSCSDSLDVSGSVDSNININDNACEVAQSNGIFYVFNRSTLLGENRGIALDSSTLYNDTPLTLDLVDSFRNLVPYTNEELTFINSNLQ